MHIVNKRSTTPSPSDIYVGRPSPLGNPFSIGKHGDRDQVIEKYGHWLLKHIREQDPVVLNALNALSADSTLVCWCAPQRCHAEMIERAWTWLQATRHQHCPTDRECCDPRCDGITHTYPYHDRGCPGHLHQAPCTA